MPRRTPVADPSKIGEASEPFFARLPNPASMFSQRAERFRAVAEGNVLADYLRFLASLAIEQHAVIMSLPAAPELESAELDLRLGAAMPPLTPELLHREPGFAETLDSLLRVFAPHSMPDPAARARERLLAQTPPEVIALAGSISEGAYLADRLAESLFVAAALQIHLARYASRLPVGRLQPVGDGVCPACGSTPVASLIVGWRGANRSRYCCCSLCGTMWNYVRIKCTSCGSTEGIAYSALEQGSQDVAAETCAKCRCYIKHLQQQRDPAVEPFADDIASYGLDLLLREQGFRRGGINPLFIAE